jgi:hypothetical protein
MMTRTFRDDCTRHDIENCVRQSLRDPVKQDRFNKFLWWVGRVIPEATAADPEMTGRLLIERQYFHLWGFDSDTPAEIIFDYIVQKIDEREANYVHISSSEKQEG